MKVRVINYMKLLGGKIARDLHGLPLGIASICFIYFMLWNFSMLKGVYYESIPGSWVINYSSIEPITKDIQLGEPIWFEGERFARIDINAVLIDSISCVQDDRSILYADAFTDPDFDYEAGYKSTLFPFGKYNNPHITTKTAENCYLRACQFFTYKGYEKRNCFNSGPFNIVE